MLSVSVRLAAALLGILGTTAWGQKFETIYSFPEDGTFGRKPFTTLTLGNDGKLYGTTTEGGAFSGGTAFRIATNGSVELLGSFNPEWTGRHPVSRLLDIGDGKFYGVTRYGGTSAGSSAGVVYQVDPLATPNGLEGVISPVLHIPGSGYTTPMDPMGLVSGEPDVLHVICYDYAGLWRVPLNGEATPAYFFGDKFVDGMAPTSIALGGDGYLYGTTIGSYQGLDGRDVYGSIFRIAPDGTGMTTIYRFLEAKKDTSEAPQGGRPNGNLISGPDGYLYGMAETGGLGKGDGTIYRIHPATGELEVVYHFQDLRFPVGELLFAPDGYFYGLAASGGKYGYGGVFRIKPNGTGYKLIRSLSYEDGGYPKAGLTIGTDGNLYGTASTGGTGKYGTVFRIVVKLPPPAENRAPVALNDFAYTDGQPIEIDARANDFDPDEDALALNITQAPQHGTVALQPGGTLRYTPDGTYSGEDQFTYTISDGRGGESSAVVQIRGGSPGPLVQSGRYTGLLMEDDDLEFDGEVPRAQISLTVSETGRFTGTLAGGKKRFALKGQFNSKGVALAQVKISKKISLPLLLSFQRGDVNVVAAVVFGPSPLTGIAGQVVTGPGEKGAATVSLLHDGPVAVGFGYGNLTILPNGNIVAKGKLGDGTKFSWGSNVVKLQEGEVAVPVFSEPMLGGVCGGYLIPGMLSSNSVGGELRWIRPPAMKSNKPYPSGIDATLEVRGALFLPTGKSDPVLPISGGTIEANAGPYTARGEFTLDGKKVSVDAPLRSLSFNGNTGLFSGKILINDKSVSFQGVVLQDALIGYGQFKNGTEFGSVELISNESVR